MTRRDLSFAAAALGALAAGLGLALAAPPDRLQGDLQRLMYVHVPSAWLAYLAFAVTFVGSVGWLVRRRSGWDRLAASSAELGAVFTGLALATGSIWGKPVWGVWWTWDPRLVTTALLFVVYLGYLALRRSVDDAAARASRAAVLGMVAFVQVPIVHMSVVWWRTLHQPPTIIRAGGPSLHPAMLAALLANLAAFTLVYGALLRSRVNLTRLDERFAASLAEGPLAGEAVGAPRVDRAPPVMSRGTPPHPSGAIGVEGSDG